LYQEFEEQNQIAFSISMVYVNPRWAVKTVISKQSLMQFGLAGRWNTFSCGAGVR